MGNDVSFKGGAEVEAVLLAGCLPPLVSCTASSGAACPSPGSACPHSPYSLVQLAGLSVGVVQDQLGVQVVQLAVAAQQEAAQLQQQRGGGGRGAGIPGKVRRQQ